MTSMVMRSPRRRGADKLRVASAKSSPVPIREAAVREWAVRSRMTLAAPSLVERNGRISAMRRGSPAIKLTGVALLMASPESLMRNS